MRVCLLLLLAGCLPAEVAVRGQAYDFSPTGGWVEGADVRVLERDDVSATTADDGSFELLGLLPGDEVTLLLDAPGRPPLQTGTWTLGDEDLEDATFQSPDDDMLGLLTRLLDYEPDPERCQIASTVTRRGRSMADDDTHGEPRATVTIAPEAGEGPVYFNLGASNLIWPDRSLVETTHDGGVLFLDVPPGDYVLRGHKPDTTFREPRLKCRPGWIVNASPPWGIQALQGGIGP